MAVTRIHTNQITDASVTGAKLADGTITGGKLEDDLSYGSNFTVTGNLTVNGDTSTVSTTNTTVEDAVVVLNSEVTGTGSTRDMGIYGEYGDDASVFMGYDVSGTEFAFISTSSAGTDTAMTPTDYLDIHAGGITADDDITSSGTITGDTITDGTISINGGDITGIGDITLTGEATFASATVSDLTSGRVVLAGTGGSLEDSANLTFDGSTLGVTGAITASTNITATGTVTGGTITDGTASLTSGAWTGITTLSTSGEATLASAIVSDLTATRVTFAGTAGALVDDADLTYATATNTLSAGNVTSAGTITGGTVTDGTLSINSGAVTGGTTATFSGAVTAGSFTTAGTLNADGLSTLGAITIDASSTLDMGDNKVTNVTDPTADQDAATKGYVDGLLSSGFTISDSEDTANTSVIANGDTLTFVPTANETTVIVGTDSVTVGLPDDVTISGDLEVDGNLIVNGTTISIDAETHQIQDPIIQIGRGPDNAALVSDDGKDRGVHMYYYEGSEKSAFMGFDTTNNNFTFVPEATITSEVVSGAPGTGVFGGLEVDNITIDGRRVTSSDVNGNLELAANGNGKVTVPTGNEFVVTDLDDTGIVFSSSGELTTDSNFTYDGTDIGLGGDFTVVNITATGTITGGTITDGTLSINSGAVTGATTITASGEITGGSVTVSDLTAGRVVYAGTGGDLSDEAGFEYNATTDTLSVANITVATEATLASAIVSDLTETRVTFAGASGALVDDAELTYATATNTLSAGNITSAGTITGDTITDGTISINGGGITGAADLTLSGTLTAGTITDGTASLTSGAWTGITTLTTSGEATLASATVSDLTDNRITIAGTSGALEDDANLTWNGTTMLIGGTSATTDVTLKVNTTDSMMPPVGTNAQRPTTGVVGMLRFNTTADTLEQYVSGGGWESVGGAAFTVIASQTFDGDGSTVAFTLSDSQTTASCIVSINGVVQLPTDAYGVSTTTLTFTEAPASGDKIEVRKLTTTQTVSGLESDGGETSVSPGSTHIDVKGDMIPTADSTYDLGSPANQWSILHVDDVQADGITGPLTGDVTGDLTGNVTGNVTGDLTGDVTGNVTGDVTGDLTGNVTGNITGNITGTPTVPSITKSGTNGVGDIGQTDNRFGDVFGTASSAEYADLAEKYEADADYEAGTVLAFGGDKEVTECADEHTTKVAGVVSTAPGYRMNDGLEAEHTAMVALTGRVPTKVTGPVAKGDMMVSAGNGMARAEANPTYGAVIGKALENWEGGEGVIEVVIK